MGLAGGVGSGKSTVAKIMSELGAGVIPSDQLGHLEINSPDVKKIITRWWTQGVIAEDGSVDRQKVASIVFTDPAQRHKLEALLHPRIAIRRSDMMAEFNRQPRVKMIVIDSPLLYEADLDLICDAVIFIDSDQATRIARSENAHGWPEGELARREKSQLALDTKRARADDICENNSTLADLRKHVERVFTKILSAYDAA